MKTPYADDPLAGHVVDPGGLSRFGKFIPDPTLPEGVVLFLNRAGDSMRVSQIVRENEQLRERVQAFTRPPGCHWVAVSDVMLGRMWDTWSPPVQVRSEKTSAKVVSLTFREVDPKPIEGEALEAFADLIRLVGWFRDYCRRNDPVRGERWNRVRWTESDEEAFTRALKAIGKTEREVL